MDQAASLRDLVAAMDAGQVDLLVILGSNPVFTAPFMDQRIPIGADIVRAVAPILGDRALGGEGIDQVAHAGAGGPADPEA